MNSTSFLKLIEVTTNTCCCELLYKLSITIYTICPVYVVLYYLGQRRQCLRPIVTAPLVIGTCATWIGVCLGRPSLQNFGRRFYGCQHWSSDSNQHCKFFQWLDNKTCPRGHETAPIVWEKFTRLATAAEATKNERDNARALEAEAREQKRVAKRKAKKSKLALRIAEHKLYKYRVALFMSWLVVGMYFLFPLYLGAMYTHNCACRDSNFCHVSYV